MAAPFDDEEREKPLDPAVERVRRKLVRFVAINLGLLLLALMAVVVAIVYRANRAAPPPAAAVSELPVPAEGEVLQGAITLPRGARVLGHAHAGGLISLHVELAGGARSIMLYDMAQDRIVGRFAVREEE